METYETIMVGRSLLIQSALRGTNWAIKNSLTIVEYEYDSVRPAFLPLVS